MLGIIIDSDSSQPILAEVPEPFPQPKEVLIAVKAASLNRADLWQKLGRYTLPQGLSPVLGLDFAGQIITVGSDVKHRKIGERVMGIVVAGGQGQRLAIHEDLTIPIPEEMSYEEAAAIPEVFITAFQTLKWQGDLQPNQRVLIHGGASGVGTACIQMARALGATPYITAGSEEKCTFCVALGAEEAIHRREEDFAKRILERTGGKGCDLIIDIVGASIFQENLHALAKGGTLILISLLDGNILEKFELSQIMDKWARIIGTTLRFRSFEYKVKLTQEFSAFAIPHFIKGSMKPIIHKIFPWKEIAKAHDILERNEAIGKIVLKIGA